MPKFALNISSVKAYLCAPIPESNGINNFKCWRYWLVLIAYTAAVLLFMHDPFFLDHGRFQLNQGWLPMLLGVVVIASCCWEMLIFGKPRGANLFLQVCMMVPVVILMTRMFGAPSAPPEATGGLMGAEWVQNLMNGLKEYLPSLKSVLAFMLVMLALCFKKTELKLAMLVLTLLVPFLMTLSDTDSRDCPFFIFGAVAMFAGMAMQYCRYDKVIYYENVYRRLKKAGEQDAAELAVIARIMGYLGSSEHARQISEGRIVEIVREEYGEMRPFEDNFTVQEFQVIAREISRRMIVKYHLATIKWVRDGMFMVPEKSLFLPEAMPLAYISKIPKMAFVGAFVLLYLLSPVDIIPDALPLVGYLDDTILAILSGWLIKDTVDDLKG